MLYVFCGSDTIAVRNQAFAFIHDFEDKGVNVRRIDIDLYQPNLFSDLVGAQSLFGEQELYLLDTLSQETTVADDVLSHLEAFAGSNNIFVVIEGTLLATPKKQFAKHATKLVEVKGVSEERYNPFGMADALLKKDKKSLWLLYQAAKQAGLSAEEIIGTLWWQVKMLRLAEVCDSASEAGVKDFPFNKAKRALASYKSGEVKTLARQLLIIYHDGHGGGKDIDIDLERWMLKV
ncbi:hypothetical protein KC845_03860 [Candidatus Kaiserbacteria bacterium]|nr:hypothetical protein [Candidatus Kaiserbacteria bacterium]